MPLPACLRQASHALVGTGSNGALLSHPSGLASCPSWCRGEKGINADIQTWLQAANAYLYNYPAPQK